MLLIVAGYTFKFNVNLHLSVSLENLLSHCHPTSYALEYLYFYYQLNEGVVHRIANLKPCGSFCQITHEDVYTFK